MATRVETEHTEIQIYWQTERGDTYLRWRERPGSSRGDYECAVAEVDGVARGLGLAFRSGADENVSVDGWRYPALTEAVR